MSSTNKTKNLKLNNWVPSDKPKREDFNMDNQIIDDALSTHIADAVLHVSTEERELWNNCVFTGTYFGNGSYSRTVSTQCPFEARFGLIFAGNKPITVAKFSTNQKHNYLGFFSATVNTLGVKMGSNKKSFEVNQSSTAVIDNEYVNLNESGVAYAYVFFR